jgi:hypothetical protein
VITLFWAFDGVRSRDAGAYPPEQFAPQFGQRDDAVRGDELQRAYLTSGREVVPSDCGPIRLLARYGHVVRSPGQVVITRLDPPVRWREHNEGFSCFGSVRVSGDPWHGTESGFVGSWIAGSEYVKICTGILVIFPRSRVLVQGPLPNSILLDADHDGPPQHLDVMTGIEYFSPRRSQLVNGVRYGIAAMNVIARVPAGPGVVTIERGQPLCWFFLGLGLPEQQLGPLPPSRTP